MSKEAKKQAELRILTVKEQFEIEADTETRKPDGTVTVDYRKRQVKLLAKATGKTEDEIENLPMPEFRTLIEHFTEANMSPSEHEAFLRARKRMEALSV